MDPAKPVDRTEDVARHDAAACSQAWMASMGHVCLLEPYGILMRRPRPSWSVVARRSDTTADADELQVGDVETD